MAKRQSMQIMYETHTRQGLQIAARLLDNEQMKKPSLLAPRLAYCRNLPHAWRASYDALIDRLRASGATDGAPGLGEIMPDFVLPDVNGNLRRLSDLLAEGPAVLSFNRGSWCPYCKQEIRAWSEHREALIAAGARLIIVTPETDGRMKALAEIAGDRAVVLCDLNLGVALLNGLAFPVGKLIIDKYLEGGFDLSEVNGTADGFLPVPATFLLDAARKVHFAFVDPDFSQRAEPEAVLAALSAILQPD